ncbi:MAG: prolipoprotein diacylglyceryl transferase [Armatimonadota bacterium]
MRPTLFNIGSLGIHSYGVMLVLGFSAGLLLAIREGRRRGISRDDIIDCALWVLLSGIIAARLLYIFLDWDYFAGQWGRWIQIQKGGLSFHGALLGAAVAVTIFASRRKIGIARLYDALTPSLPLGYAIARIGCFLNGCCQGTPTHLPWGVAFPKALEGSALVAQPVHPTQIYASLLSLVVFGVVLLLRTRLHWQGQLFLSYLALYSAQRYAVEIYRSGASAHVFPPLAPLTQAQVVSLVIALAAAAALILTERRRLSQPEPEPEPEPAPAPETEPTPKKKRTHR